ncbi:MAG TPA: cyclic nucleotide-binding domain-containing protein [Candidatus Hydrogenedentes bacterium]|nr:cyclic nucleotide-binding domain-containing protein [Candidatus Hydrogenedentota bacterium]
MAEKLSGVEGSVSDILEMIRQNVILLVGLTTVQLRELLFDSEVRQVAPGEVIYERNDFSNSLYVILQGEVDMAFPSSDLEREATLIASLDPERHVKREAGEFFGEMSLISGRRRAGTATAINSCVLIEVPRLVMARLLRLIPEMRGVIDSALIDGSMSALLSSSSSGLREIAARGAEVLHFRPGDVLFEEGDDPDGLHLICRGSVTISKNQGVERNTVMFLLKEGGAHEATDLLLIDESLCVRCNNCEKACSDTHSGVSRLDREAGPTYQTSSGSQLHVPTACQHCENPKCMDDCPPDAIRRHSDGEVYIMDNCIGCGNCYSNCPYGVIQMHAISAYRPRGVLWDLLFGPLLPSRTKSPGKAGDEEGHGEHAVKCDLCRDRSVRKKGVPKAACVSACPTGALVRVKPRDFIDEIRASDPIS